MAITSEQIWEVAPRGAKERDAFVFGRPATRIIGEEPARLMHGVDWSRIARSATVGFFDDRDPGCDARSTLAKILAVVVAMTGVSLLCLFTLAVLGAWAIDAILT